MFAASFNTWSKCPNALPTFIPLLREVHREGLKKWAPRCEKFQLGNAFVCSALFLSTCVCSLKLNPYPQNVVSPWLGSWPQDEHPNFPCEIYNCRKRKVSEREGERDPGPFSRGLLNEAERKFWAGLTRVHNFARLNTALKAPFNAPLKTPLVTSQQNLYLKYINNC